MLEGNALSAIVARMTNTLAVLAAGIGSRYGGLKQMDPVGPSGEFILDYSVYDAIRAGFDKIVFVVSSAIEEPFKQTIGKRIEEHAEVEYVTQSLADVPAGFRLPPDREKPWGTGHAVLACRDVIDGPFAVINADDFYGAEAYAVLSDFLKNTAPESNLYAMVGYLLGNTVSDHGSVARGICRVDEDDELVEVVERTRIEKENGAIRYADDEGTWHALAGDEQASMNFWGFKQGFMNALTSEFSLFMKEHGADPKAEFFIPSVVNMLLSARRIRVKVLKTTSPWFGVTYPQDKPCVVEAIRGLVDEGKYPLNLWGQTSKLR